MLIVFLNKKVITVEEKEIIIYNMNFIIILLVLVLSVELHFKPRLDKTREGDILLWYNSGHNRKYIKLN